MQRRPLTLGQLELLGRAATGRELLLLRTLYETGCTVSELVALRTGNASALKGVVNVGGRAVPVSPDLLRLIGQAPGGYLFPSRESGRMTPRRVEQLLAALGRRAIGSPVTPHQLRSSRIIHDFLNRIPIPEIERRLGLKSIQPHLYAYFRDQAEEAPR